MGGSVIADTPLEAQDAFWGRSDKGMNRVRRRDSGLARSMPGQFQEQLAEEIDLLFD